VLCIDCVHSWRSCSTDSTCWQNHVASVEQSLWGDYTSNDVDALRSVNLFACPACDFKVMFAISHCRQMWVWILPRHCSAGISWISLTQTFQWNLDWLLFSFTFPKENLCNNCIESLAA